MSRRSLLGPLIEAQRGYCAGCGVKMAPIGWVALEQDMPSVDHVWPRSGGGGDHMGNMVAMHRRCNSAKGNRPPTGCERIWHEVVLAHLGLSRFDAVLPDFARATLADVWPSDGSAAG